MDNIQKLRESVCIVDVQTQAACPHPSEMIDLFADYGTVEADIKGSVSLETQDGEKLSGYKVYLLRTQLQGVELEGHYPDLGVLVNNTQRWAKVYAGFRAFACTNLMINAETILQTGLNTVEVRTALNACAHLLVEQAGSYQRFLERLQNNTYNTQEAFNNRKGHIMSKIPMNLFSYIKHAEEQFRDPDSIYFNWENSDWKILSAMTDYVKNKAPLSHIDDTLLLQKIFIDGEEN